MKTGKDMVELFDRMADKIDHKGKEPKDLSLVIETLHLLLKQMNLSDTVLETIKEECAGLDDKELKQEFRKRLLPLLEPLQKSPTMRKSREFNMTLLSLPEKKGRKFFELMASIEEANALELMDAQRERIIHDVKDSLKGYIIEMEEIQRSSV